MTYAEKSYTRLGEKLREARKERKLTQAALAEGIVTRNMLSRIENGAASPSLSVICALADRLSVPVGYLIDDRDDGTGFRNRRLLDMILEEFSAERYDTCLTYCEALEDYEEIVNGIRAACRFRLAKEKMYDGRLNEAQKLFAGLAKEPEDDHVPMNECLLYRGLLSGFLSEPEQGKEEGYLRSLLTVARAPHDLVTLAGVLTALQKNGVASARTVLSLSVFKERCYALLLEAKLLLEEKEYDIAMKKLIETAGYRLLPPIECYCLTLFERCAAGLKDYERAYAYMERRRDLVRELTKKV